ncbi:MAG TPA: ABC transporter permease [Beijerinckiaceae bacterium]|nr:ABC transporter permease [Beijerinckiaceae bacterium]
MQHTEASLPTPAPASGNRFWQSDIAHSFMRSKVTMLAALVTLIFFVGALLAPWIAPNDPYDLRQLSLLNSNMPPAWVKDGSAQFPLGTDDQGRCVLSTILYGLRISLGVGFVAVGLSAVLGILLGLTAGYIGGRLDSFIMRVADVQLAFPAILIALFVDGTMRGLFPHIKRENSAFLILVIALTLAFWVQYARTVRGSTIVEKNREYVQAARVIGLPAFTIMIRHVLPNVLGPVLVIATINLGLAILSEATLSFLGVGFPPTEPSLGAMIQIGSRFLFSGEWWITVFPGAALAILVLAINMLGDWLRDALNPRLR